MESAPTRKTPRRPPGGLQEGPIQGAPLSPDQLRAMNAYWRAANYLSVGHISLYDNRC